MVKRMCTEQPKLWDRYLPAVLFAYREASQASTGFSPFELLYGRTIIGPLSILREVWDKEPSEVRTTYQHVFDLRERLEATCKLAQEELSKAQEKYKQYYDRKAKERKFQAGDKVLLLRPTTNNKLLVQWKGPYSVVERKGEMDYIIGINGDQKIFHANMLKLYHSRTTGCMIEETTAGAVRGAAAAVIEEPERETDDDSGTLSRFQPKETWEHVKIGEQLSTEQQATMMALLQKYINIHKYGLTCLGKRTWLNIESNSGRNK